MPPVFRNVQKINFARNPHENAALRAGVAEIAKLFYKNVLDVWLWFW